MVLHGLQKMTLLDFPGRVACTLFTAGCNMRCPFCHNARLVEGRDEPLDTEATLAWLATRQGLLDGVCLTGGEPTLQPDVADFIARIKAMGFAVKLDTNGTRPDRLRELLQAGLLDYVAMDIKNSPALYPATAGGDVDIAAIERSVQLLMASGTEYEFRTTVVRELHTVDSIADAARFIAGAKQYFLQQFVDSGDLIGAGLNAHTPETLAVMRDAAAPYVENCAVRGV